MAENSATAALGVVEAVSSGRLGGRVKELRRGRGLTLEELAERSGVSRAMISKLERGEKNPTLVVAARLAEGLGVTLSRLAGAEERREVVVVPRERRMVMRDPETGFERQLLSPTFSGRGVEFVRNVVPEDGTSGEFPPHRRGVQEHLVVEKGELRARLGGEEYRLREGDALYFEADVPHRFDNVGAGECSYYLVINSAGAV
ncbi:MAG: Transcriptional regulator, Xre-family with cupin domain [uncultured Rubrobacteraceae bacterium]|uniref:Transcriptional regulator, Xre-family with cupin domain n=1 Tax=uncultured Rubrobacteraceae bacterium TaxID=349277 RepID=A0A6J4QNC8_9ACTN|nr:MAG: Transcriptional regulator, Xre-family with cupin domain [uncultured Rubrobacteraceae bacterium]